MDDLRQAIFSRQSRAAVAGGPLYLSLRNNISKAIEGGTLKPGAKADIALIALDEPWLVAKEQLLSRSKNTPFEDARFSGRAVSTYVAGRQVFGV